MESSNAIVGIVIIVLLVGIGVGAFFIYRNIKNKAQAKLDAMSPAERELYDAELEYSAAVKAAEKVLKNEEKAQNSRVKEAQKEVVSAQALGSKRLGSYGGLTLTETNMFTSSATIPLTSDITASVETAGNLAVKSRSTLTRIAAGGLLFGPAGAIVGGIAKKSSNVDKRELYLLIESSTFSELIVCKPDDGAKVRQFAIQIKQSALAADSVREHRQLAIDQAKANLEKVVADKVLLDQAVKSLETTKADTSRIEAAKSRISIPNAD